MNLKRQNSVRAVAADQSIKLWLVLGSNCVDVLRDLDACIYFKFTTSESGQTTELYRSKMTYVGLTITLRSTFNSE
jgi:hypothetical protein